VRNAAGDPIHGGTTATLVVMVKDANGAGATLITANVGDSTAFLVPTRGTWDFLSVDHGPENHDEWMRINVPHSAAAQQVAAALGSSAAAASSAGGAPSAPVDPYPTKLLFVYDKTNVFRKYECPSVFLPDGTKDQLYVANPWGYGLHPTNVRYEPAVYAVTPRSVTKDSTCIAMTRALGDCYAHQFGLTHLPSISVKRLEAKDSHSDDTTQSHINSYATTEQAYTIFVASDGVWDCWKYDDLMQFINDELIQRHKTLLEMGEDVLEESISRAITNFGAKHYDDACLVVWQFTPQRVAQQTQQQQQQQQQQQPAQQQQRTADQQQANGASGAHGANGLQAAHAQSAEQADADMGQ